MRKEELIYAKWENFNEERRTLWLPETKEKKPKSIFLSERTFRAIKSLPNKGISIFLNSKNKVWVKINRDIRIFCGQLGIKGYTHKFRHTYASYSLACGMPVQTLKSRLGHGSLATTDNYSQVINFRLPPEIKKLFGDWGIN